MQSSATNTHSTSQSPEIRISRSRSIAAVLALSLGCFSFVSTELMPVGVLRSMASGLNVSLGHAGYLITIFAFVTALTATPLTSLLSSVNRKILMAGLLGVCFTGNLITYLAPSYFVVVIGRIIVASAVGVFWSTAVVTAVHLVSASNGVRATSVVLGGVSLATVLGVPAGTILGELYGWRSVFAALCFLNLIIFTLIVWSVPAVRIFTHSRRGAISALFNNGSLLVIFGITALVVTGNFLAYAYIMPFLQQVAGLSAGRLSLLLLVYGAAGVITNFSVGPLASRIPRTSLGLVVTLFAASLASMNAASGSYTTIFIAIAVWGAAYGAIPVLLQTLIFKEASRLNVSADAATSINVSVFNVSIGVGSLIGGLVITQVGTQLIPYVAAGFGLAGLIAILISREGKSLRVLKKRVVVPVA